MRGPQTTSALAEALAISVPGVRQQLDRLQADGLVQARSSGGGVGRPALVWSLTEDTQALFPDTHGELTVALIESIRNVLGDEALESVIAEREAMARVRYRKAMGTAKSLGARVKRLAALRSDEGYMAQVERAPDGAWILAENHCPICAAARTCQGFCRHELELFRELMGSRARVERTEYVLTGSRRCAYRVSARRP